ncbi:MAG: FtsX-like permease family protein [bacterium]
MSRPLPALLRRLALRRMREEPLRLALTVSGVALGVAVVLAIQLANTSAVRAFRNSLDAIAGEAHLQVGGGDLGIPEDLFLRVRDDAGVRYAAPVVQQAAWIRKDQPGIGRWKRGTDSQGRSILVLGVDLIGDSKFRRYKAGKDLSLEETLSRLADPEGIFLTRRLAEEIGVGEGERVQLDAAGRRRFRVRGILQPSKLAEVMEGRIAIMDIGVAQEAFARLGRLDRIDLILKKPDRLPEVRRRLAALLPPGVVVERPVRRGEDVERMLASFQLNLTVLSGIALLVGCFLVFNAMSASVVRRRAEIGMLRALGMTARGVAALFAAEAALIGFAGSLLGLALGWLLARGTLLAVTRTIRNLYAFLQVSEVRADPLWFGAALAAGTGAALLSGLLPAIGAARVPPAPAARDAGGAAEAGPRLLAGTLAAAGAAGGAALIAASLPAWGGVPLFGYLSALLVAAGLALLCPAAVAGGAALLRRLLGGALAPWLAAHGMGRHLRRNAVTVASLATAVAMLVSLVVMIESFRETVMVWTGQTLRADLYAAPSSRFIKGSSASFPAQVAERLRRVPGVAAVDILRVIRLPWRGGRVRVAGGDFRVAAARSGLLFREGESAEILRRAREAGEAIVTETFSLRFGVVEGDVVRLPAPGAEGGEVSLRVAGVYYDYTTNGGLLVVDEALFRRLWRDDRLSSAALYLAPGADRDRVWREAESLLAEDMVLISNSGLRRRVFDVFDQTFSITYALEAIALLVAALGVAAGLSSNVMERRREIGTLRSLGLSRRGVAAAVVGEAGLLGLIAAALGTGGGAALAAILVLVINKQSFGWTLRFGVPVWEILGYLSLIVLAALAAGWPPARAAARTPIAEAVREE